MKKMHPHPIDIRPGQRSPWYAVEAYMKDHPQAVGTVLHFALGSPPDSKPRLRVKREQAS